jgi:predicted Zn-dependent protease
MDPTVGGYHFDVLNSDEINGVSGPGGWVLLAGRGLAAKTEDESPGSSPTS